MPPEPFPLKLHRMLQDVEKNFHTDIVSWLPCGRAFRVHMRKEFTDHIMKRYFNQSKFKSFQRQLNLWGFQQTNAVHPHNGYHHPLFVRGQPTLAAWMERTGFKGNKSTSGKTRTSQNKLSRATRQGAMVEAAAAASSVAAQHEPIPSMSAPAAAFPTSFKESVASHAVSERRFKPMSAEVVRPIPLASNLQDSGGALQEALLANLTNAYLLRNVAIALISKALTAGSVRQNQE